MKRITHRRVVLAVIALATTGVQIESCTLTTDQATVIAAGYSMNSAGVFAAGYWQDGTWIGLTPLDPTKKHLWIRSL